MLTAAERDALRLSLSGALRSVLVSLRFGLLVRGRLRRKVLPLGGASARETPGGEAPARLVSLSFAQGPAGLIVSEVLSRRLGR